jgi:hypothetical protein
MYLNGGLTRRLGPQAARSEIQSHAADPLGNDLVTGAKNDVEVRQDHLPCFGGIATGCNNIETDRRNDLLAPCWQLARMLVIVAVTSIASAAMLFDGLNIVTSPVPAGIPGIGHALRSVQIPPWSISPFLPQADRRTRAASATMRNFTGIGFLGGLERLSSS